MRPGDEPLGVGLGLNGHAKAWTECWEHSSVDYFAGMRAFVRAVELGSFSRAAAEEGVKVSTVSRYVTALEADLGAALFNRSTRRLCT